MSRPPWVVEPAPAPDGARGLAFLAADRAFALFNDYERGRAVLVRDAPELAMETPFPGFQEHPTPLVREAQVEGYGVFTFPYGPISMGVPEAGRFDVRTYGERILGLTPLAGFKSRRIREAVAGLRPDDAALRIERMAGNFSAAHVAAFLYAVECAEGRALPAEEFWTRALAQELQRIYNHLHVIARVAEAASQNVGLAQTHALAEEVLRAQGTIFGHRWLFGALLPNGPERHLDPSHRAHLGETLSGLAANFETLWSLFLESRTFVDRIQSTGTVTKSAAIRAGAVGPTLRACGVNWDDRLRVPIPPYDDLFVALPHESAGDALARLVVRAGEVRSSFLLLEQLLDRWPSRTSTIEPSEARVAEGRALARVEAPSGDLVYDVELRDHRVVRLDLRTPSQANWGVFAAGLRDAVFTDFHFAFESFGLVFAETDG